MEFIQFLTFISILLSANCETISSEQDINVKKSEEMLASRLSFTLADECDEDETCVRFCCVNATECFEESFFDLNTLPEAQLLKTPYKVLKGRPNCKDFSVVEEWEFSEARILN